MKKVITVFIILSFLVGAFGCNPQFYQSLPTMCDSAEAEGSWICYVCSELGVRVEDVDLMFRIATVKGLTEDQKTEAVKLMTELINFIDSPLSTTYNAFFDEAENVLLESDIILIQDYIASFRSDQIIIPYDKYLIKLHLERQIKVLSV